MQAIVRNFSFYKPYRYLKVGAIIPVEEEACIRNYMIIQIMSIEKVNETVYATALVVEEPE